MSHINARSLYRRSELAGASELSDPHEIIGVTLRELEKSLRVLAAARSAGGVLPERHLTRAFTAIYILQSSLDFERGGDIAAQLFRVYEYCRLQVTRLFRREPEAELAVTVDTIAAIRDAWDQIA
ncbi:flagellar protein FliS [Plastorhodobacter daqingensis]|uniref:Flagellar protein FliS n=1 Tax=Plastorhodobacter daqingensis TaxID=1387281 RepID=A0ABW2UG11_9RHOB